MHRPYPRAAVVGALALLVLAGAPALAVAQPSAEQVIARYVEAIGGRDAVLRQTSSRTIARMEIPAMGMSGEIEVLIASPGNMIQKLTIAGLGESQTGVIDGKAWAVDPMQGPRLITGGEAEQLVHSTDPTVALRDAKHFTSREVVGEEEYDGEKCVAVRFVWVSGRQSTDCYSTETGLLIASRSQVESPMGIADMTTRAGNYRDHGGVRMPTTLNQSMMGVEQRITIESVELGGVSADAVEPPAAIRTMLDRAGN
jgi:hypothetical protein